MTRTLNGSYAWGMRLRTTRPAVEVTAFAFLSAKVDGFRMTPLQDMRMLVPLRPPRLADTRNSGHGGMACVASLGGNVRTDFRVA